MEETVRMVIEYRQSVRSTAVGFDLCHQPLNRQVPKLNAMRESQVNVEYSTSKMVLNEAEELELSQYILESYSECILD